VTKMVLADTSIWVEHLRNSNNSFIKLLDEGRVLIHPFIIGELACGNIRNRVEILSLLRKLPSGTVANNEEIIIFIDRNQLMGKGLGYVDVHLLASALLSNVCLWTNDKALAGVATEMEIGFDLNNWKNER
jgi:predicted nucleic acid-binding protein